MKFEWDPNKAASNVRRHGIAFEDAASVFGDPLARTIPDPEHSTEETRFVTMGMTAGGRLVVVVHTDREGRTRLISARPATRREKKSYEKADRRD